MHFKPNTIPHLRQPQGANATSGIPNYLEDDRLPVDYFRLRDFEYAQPIYDLAYFLEVNAIAKNEEIPKFRTFSLWRAAYGFDGYSTIVDKWLVGKVGDDSLDYLPSDRIRNYLLSIRDTGTIPELAGITMPEHERAKRLRAIKGIGISQIASSLSEGYAPSDQWLNAAIVSSQLPAEHIFGTFQGAYGTWQAAHIVPPLVRLLREFESCNPTNRICSIECTFDGIKPVCRPFLVEILGDFSRSQIEAVLSKQPLFRIKSYVSSTCVIEHQLGWYFILKFASQKTDFDLYDWTINSDPFLQKVERIKSDLHLHTAWSDGNASLASIAIDASKAGLSHFAVTDHSRSSKLQGGLTPILWLRQAASIALNQTTCSILHGIEVDILSDGKLDLPAGLLSGMDLVVASVHSNWTTDERSNTERMIRAIESGLVDILGHPTSSLVGKPGIPNFVRHRAKVDWKSVFAECAKWSVALELNCFPSRLDLSLDMLETAIGAGCWISLGSDAHSRSHLAHLRFGEAIIKRLKSDRIINLLSFAELKNWLFEARESRSRLTKTQFSHSQPDLFAAELEDSPRQKIEVSLNQPERIPSGSKIIGFDLTAGKGKPTGVALLDGMSVWTYSLVTDEELVEFVQRENPKIVSIDSPLGFPGGGPEIDPSKGIVRVAEHDLSSVGIPAYPALIDSMKELTSRGVRLRRIIEGFENPPTVIESYPGAAQDVLCIPRKQKSLDLLRNGLAELGVKGPGLLTQSHDEMDAITSAVVGRFFECGQFLPMGIPSESQLIVPRIRPLQFAVPPIICLAGKTGAGKSVVARYLALFYGFRWIKTRDIVREILEADCNHALSQRLCQKHINQDAISDADLRDFGVVILEKYKQEPLRRKLTEMISDDSQPVVVDSIRDLNDLERAYGVRPLSVWYLDCQDSIITNRLFEKRKIPTFKSRPNTFRIDKNSLILRQQSDYVILNSTSLEDLRWKIDDILFESLLFKSKRE